MGVNVESLGEQNNFDKSTCFGDSMYDIFWNEKDIITLRETVWVWKKQGDLTR